MKSGLDQLLQRTLQPAVQLEQTVFKGQARTKKGHGHSSRAAQCFDATSVTFINVPQKKGHCTSCAIN